jgi:hypothetical protein
MKVICINEDAWPGDYPKDVGGGKIKTGETYKVIDVFFVDGFIWFELSIDRKFGYWENCFARLSSIDETEFVREYKKEKV